MQLNGLEDTSEKTFISEPTINNKCKDVGVSRAIDDVGDRACGSLVYAEVEYFEALKEELFLVADSPTALCCVFNHGVEVLLQVYRSRETVDLKEVHSTLMSFEFADAVACPNQHGFPIFRDFKRHFPGLKRAISERACSSHNSSAPGIAAGQSSCAAIVGQAGIT